MCISYFLPFLLYFLGFCLFHVLQFTVKCVLYDWKQCLEVMSRSTARIGKVFKAVAGVVFKVTNGYIKSTL